MAMRRPAATTANPNRLVMTGSVAGPESVTQPVHIRFLAVECHDVEAHAKVGPLATTAGEDGGGKSQPALLMPVY